MEFTKQRILRRVFNIYIIKVNFECRRELMPRNVIKDVDDSPVWENEAKVRQNETYYLLQECIFVFKEHCITSTEADYDVSDI